MIRTFHRVWIGDAQPDHDVAVDWLELNPGWMLLDWYDQDLGWIVNRATYEQADALTPPWYVTRFRANLARYEILARYGGVYLDWDFAPLAPLEEHLPSGAWAAEERAGVLANGICGADRPGNLFWRLMVDGLPHRARRLAGKPSNESTGPWYLTDVARCYPELITRMPTDMFYPYSWRDLYEQGRPPDFEPAGVVAHHLWAGRPGVRT